MLEMSKATDDEKILEHNLIRKWTNKLAFARGTEKGNSILLDHRKLNPRFILTTHPECLPIRNVLRYFCPFKISKYFR